MTTSNSGITELLEQVAGRLREAVHRQRAEQPAHEDFYTWGWALGELSATLTSACRVLSGQVSGYGRSRVLREDTGTADPHQRLTQARQHLGQLAAHLHEATAAAAAYHAAISHIGVHVNPHTPSENEND